MMAALAGARSPPPHAATILSIGAFADLPGIAALPTVRGGVIGAQTVTVIAAVQMRGASLHASQLRYVQRIVSRLGAILRYICAQ
jgi:hypothetical protein